MVKVTVEKINPTLEHFKLVKKRNLDRIRKNTEK